MKRPTRRILRGSREKDRHASKTSPAQMSPAFYNSPHSTQGAGVLIRVVKRLERPTVTAACVCEVVPLMRTGALVIDHGGQLRGGGR